MPFIGFQFTIKYQCMGDNFRVKFIATILLLYIALREYHFTYDCSRNIATLDYSRYSGSFNPFPQNLSIPKVL